MTNEEIEIYRPLVEKVSKRLYLRRSVARIGELSDVFSIGWIGLLEALGRAKKLNLDGQKLESYLVRAVSRDILDESIKADRWSFKSIDQLPDEEIDVVLAVPDSQEPSRFSREVSEALEKLDDESANILRWSYGIGRPKLTIDKIAVHLGVDYYKARALVRAARKKLKRVLEKPT